MGFALARPRRRSGPMITLVPMIDVMMILLIFFMVTSTYLDLDRIPAVAPEQGGGAAAAGEPRVVMIRIAETGAVIRGTRIAPDELGAAIAAELAQDRATQFLLLPSAEAPLQALVAAMDAATAAGARSVRVIRLEGR